MKGGRIKIITYVGIISIVLLQFIWLYNTYAMTRDNVKKKANELLDKAINREVCLRMSTATVPEGYSIESSPVDGTSEVSFIGFQESLYGAGSNISLSAVDSIYRGLLTEFQIETDVILAILDKDSKVIDSTIHCEALPMGYGLINTKAIPIRFDESLNVQAIIVNPYWFILRRMALIIFATIIIMIFVGWCIIYQIKVVIAERRISQLKDTFSKAMIHEMKTPIAGIKLSTHLLRSIKPEEVKERDEMLGYIEKENEHLSALANKVLTIAKIEENKIVLNKKEFRLPSMIEDLVATYKQRNHKQVEFSLQLNVDTAFGEEEYIKEAISNLIDNAIKYSGDSVKITIGSAIEADMLCISVEDNGFGISREDRNRIFEKFQRGVGALKKGVSGFGLGLNYVKHVAEAHGGRADMMSRKGYGSVFMIMIPTKN